jgi:hypothetical protein
LDEVLGEYGQAAQVMAQSRALDIDAYGTICFKDTVTAVTVYVATDYECDKRADLSAQDWIYLIDHVDEQAKFGQEVSVLFMQVANDVTAELTQSSKVDMIRVMANFQITIRSLIEGNLANHIPPPPTQQIADDLIHGYETWTTMEAELQVVINLALGQVPDRVIVHAIVSLSAKLLQEVEHAAHLLMEEATVYAPQVKPYLIEVSGRQRMLQQQIAKEAHVIRNYGKHNEDNTHDWDTLRSSIAMWKDTHDLILKGYPSKNISAVTSLCVIWALKYAKDDFYLVEKDALGVAEASDEVANAMIQELADVLPKVLSA